MRIYVDDFWTRCHLITESHNVVAGRALWISPSPTRSSPYSSCTVSRWVCPHPPPFRCGSALLRPLSLLSFRRTAPGLSACPIRSCSSPPRALPAVPSRPRTKEPLSAAFPERGTAAGRDGTLLVGRLQAGPGEGRGGAGPRLPGWRRSSTARPGPGARPNIARGGEAAGPLRDRAASPHRPPPRAAAPAVRGKGRERGA